MLNLRPKRGFTLIEIVIVMVLLGILAVVAVPKFIDLAQQAKISSTQASLGAVRSTLNLIYAERVLDPNIGASFPSSITNSDFANNTLPLNHINGHSGVAAVSTVPGGTATLGTSGFWYIVADGQAGAYSDGAVDTSGW